ncbi:CCA tRNA nucleotidyltransferase [Sporanaerobium hydrogeniformans]|uniref:CCA tRNA nucleotidyltransferase n=1 Tax=Sporanaerobium hydrogeniformans TaxID=3072179 RepID=A0AC61DD49_9FIRM|nr:CCA tRNA nucleotidyltransferase [Sporanaerobium hydrogeniformans]PHV70522.1 CCA tRNA nucleotidyltransferase [Sporanaerobium hydrogeniformans]
MNKKYNALIPSDAIAIIEAIEAAGFEAYIVGGCVRDMLMHREPNDWDITTSARPEQIKKIFNRTYDTGIKHGTVTIILNKEHYEVTTYRIEGEYKDFRRPENVDFVEDINLDLSRRDFTMNAIAYHPERGFVDPYGGITDIKKGCIRSVRNAKERFEEDALRILRGVRFAAQLGFVIEAQTIEGIEVCKELLIHISKERIRDEFLKICLSPRPSYITELYKLDLLKFICPDFIKAYHMRQNHPHHIYNVAEHTLVAMEYTAPTVLLRLTLFLHDIGKVYTHTVDKKGIDHFYDHSKKSVEIGKKVLKDLRLDNETIKSVSLLIEYHDYHLTKKISKFSIKEVMSVMGSELFDQLIEVQAADVRAQNPEKLAKKLKAIEEQRKLKEEILAKNECYNKKMLAITGQDLIEVGIPKGALLGQILDQVLLEVMKKPEINTKEVLLAYSLKYYEKLKH